MSNVSNSENWREVTIDLEQSPTKVKHSRSITRPSRMVNKLVRLPKSPPKRKVHHKQKEVRHLLKLLQVGL